MNGKDVILGLEFVGDDLIEKAEFGRFPAKKSTNLRRPLLIAAIVAMLLLLVGCTVVYLLSIQKLSLGEQQAYQDAFEYDPDTGAAIAYLGQETVTERVLTLAGLKGSPNYLAAQEWFDFKQNYDPDYEIRASLGPNVPKFPEEYEAYNIYTQEMKDKLDEILHRYDLRLIGRSLPFRTEELTCKAVGLENISVPGSGAAFDLNYASYQECGNFSMEFNLTLPGGGDQEELNIRCHIFYMHKDAFTENVISLREIETWEEWNYQTASGANVLIFHSPADWRGYIFCDMPSYTVTLQFTFIDERYSNDASGNVIIEKNYMTVEQIKRLADAIDFSREPKLAENWETLADSSIASGEVIDGYSIKLKSVESDGIHTQITLGITAPEDVDLVMYSGYPVMLKPGNRWGFFEDISGGGGNVSGGYGTEDDGDGKRNTQNVVLRYSANSHDLRSGDYPFDSGKRWNIYWQDIYAQYLNEETNEAEEVLLVKGTWSFDVVYEDVKNEELELIVEPMDAKAAYGWDLQENDVYQETKITSFVLRALSATIVCDMERAAPDFLTVGDRCVHVRMSDGSEVRLYGDSAGPGVQNLQPESTIDLSRVVSVLMPDGTEFTVPQA